MTLSRVLDGANRKDFTLDGFVACGLRIVPINITISMRAGQRELAVVNLHKDVVAEKLKDISYLQYVVPLKPSQVGKVEISVTGRTAVATWEWQTTEPFFDRTLTCACEAMRRPGPWIANNTERECAQVDRSGGASAVYFEVSFEVANTIAEGANTTANTRITDTVRIARTTSWTGRHAEVGGLESGSNVTAAVRACALECGEWRKSSTVQVTAWPPARAPTNLTELRQHPGAEGTDVEWDLSPGVGVRYEVWARRAGCKAACSAEAYHRRWAAQSGPNGCAFECVARATRARAVVDWAYDCVVVVALNEYGHRASQPLHLVVSEPRGLQTAFWWYVSTLSVTLAVLLATGCRQVRHVRAAAMHAVPRDLDPMLSRLASREPPSRDPPSHSALRDPPS